MKLKYVEIGKTAGYYGIRFGESLRLKCIEAKSDKCEGCFIFSQENKKQSECDTIACKSNQREDGKNVVFVYGQLELNENMTTIEKVEQWVTVRNLHTQDPKVQMCKIVEELGELARAINKGDVKGQIDGIGDTVVTLICISMQLGLKFDDCLDYSYNEIKGRKGKFVNGMFVKESDLK